jgi:class 3 adenylate cyclase
MSQDKKTLVEEDAPQDTSVLTQDDTLSDPFSDELVLIETKGFIGLLERVPLSVKLTMMITVSLLGLLAVAIFLIAVEGVNIHGAKQELKFVSVAQLVSNAMNNVQSQRHYCDRNIVDSTSQTIGYLETYVNDGASILSALDSLYQSYANDPTMQNVIAQYFTYRNQLPVYVASCYNQNITADQAISYYYNLTDSMWAVLVRLNYYYGVTIASDNFVVILRATDMQSLIRTLGSNAYDPSKTTNIGTMTTSEYSLYSKFIGERDIALKIWMWHSSQTDINYFEQNGQIAVAEATALENYLLTSLNFTDNLANVTEPPSLQSVSWDSVSYIRLNQFYALQTRVLNELVNASNASRGQAIGLIVGAIIVAIFFFIVVLFSSICSAMTIVGPWKRMNRMQEMAINKFVPQKFLKLIGCNKISDVNLGKFVEQNLTILHADIRQFEKITSNLKPEQIFQFVNTYFNYIGPLISKYGFIHQYNGDGFTALFDNAAKGLKASIEIQQATETFNANYANNGMPPVSLGIGVQAGTMLVGTVGENERINGTIISHHDKISRLLQHLARKFNVSMLTTSLAVDNNKNKNTFKHIHFRILGPVQVDATGGEKLLIDVYEVVKKSDTQKLSHKNMFDSALMNFQRGLYLEALEQFDTLLKKTPDDIIVQLYLEKTKQLLNQVRYIASTLSVKIIMEDEVFRSGFETYCNVEQSTENIAFWKDIQQFKKANNADLREIANMLVKKYLSDDTININKKLKTQVFEQIKETSQPIDIHIFDAILIDLEIMLTDTLARFKGSSEFYHYFDRSRYAPPRPFLDQL